MKYQPDKKIQYLNKEGQFNLPPNVDFPIALLQQMYTTMMTVRMFDNKAVALQRTGQIGTYASCLGQEAVSTGIGTAMSKDDVLVGYYRDQAAQYLRGVRFHQMLQYWGGDERGNVFNGTASQDFPNSVPIATQVTHAAGVATAFKIRGEKRVAVTTIGEGGTSRGDFYEAMNLAGVWHLPLVIVVNNNQWAISVPREHQTAAKNIAIKSQAAGIEGIWVDGNDVVAVYDVVKYALDKARRGKGATLIEAETYRLCDHTTADDATRYRNVDEVNKAWEEEPMKRLRTYLYSEGFWSPDREKLSLELCQQEVDKEVQTYLSLPPQEPHEMFDHLYEVLPSQYQQQYDNFVAKGKKNG